MNIIIPLGIAVAFNAAAFARANAQSADANSVGQRAWTTYVTMCAKRSYSQVMQGPYEGRIIEYHELSIGVRQHEHSAADRLNTASCNYNHSTGEHGRVVRN